MIYIIGIGIEGKSSLSQRGLKLIEGAGMLVGGKRYLAWFSELEKKKIVIGSNLDEVVEVIRKKSEVRSLPLNVSIRGQKSENIVVLATGDPNFFGIADFLIKRLGKDAVEIIPNISTMQYAFAKIKESWNDARFLSVHGRGRSQKSEVRSQKENTFSEIIDEIVCYNKVGIFTDPDNTPSKIARTLIDKGIKDYKVYVCEDLGTDNEKITQGTLGRIAKKRFSPLNVMALIRSQKSNVFHASRITHHGIFGIPDSEFFHSKGMITKEEIRVISLAKLKLKADSILWDIGAGSGSLSIEAAMLANNGKVFAVEKDAARIKHIEKNKEKFKAVNLEIICKKATACLRNLPAPDAVFIGGGGKDVGKILEVCSKRIKQYGRIVVNAITVETLATAAHFFETSGWNMETVSVNIAKTKLIPAGLKQGNAAGLHLFNAYNPVFVIVGEKP